MPSKRLQTTLACAAAAIAAAAIASPAHAATAKIGATDFIEGNIPFPNETPGGYLLQLTSAAPRSFKVPAGYGVITAWRHYTGPNSGPLAFKVYRPTPTGGEYTVLARDERAVTANMQHTFPVQVRVQPGDEIGISTDSEVYVAYDTNNLGDILAFLEEDSPAGQTETRGDTTEEYVVAVMAIVETDADGDGFGDDSQDADDDNDGTPDTEDLFPLNPAESRDTDGDGQGDNADADDDNDGLADAAEATLTTSSTDHDSDDDGLADASEDKNRDGRKGRKETNAAKRDTDGDKLTDGVERGVKVPVADPAGAVLGTDTTKFKKDADPKTKTNPLKKDSDKDGLRDGKEDKDRDGKKDKRETAANRKDSDKDGTSDKKDDAPLNRRVE